MNRAQFHKVILIFASLGTPTIVCGQVPAVVSSEQALTTDAQHYARNYGVSLDEAKRRLLIMANSGPEIEALEQEFKGKIAGIYFDNRGEFKLSTPTLTKFVR